MSSALQTELTNNTATAREACRQVAVLEAKVAALEGQLSKLSEADLGDAHSAKKRGAVRVELEDLKSIYLPRAQRKLAAAESATAATQSVIAKGKRDAELADLRRRASLETLDRESGPALARASAAFRTLLEELATAYAAYADNSDAVRALGLLGEHVERIDFPRFFLPVLREANERGVPVNSGVSFSWHGSDVPIIYATSPDRALHVFTALRSFERREFPREHVDDSCAKLERFKSCRTVGELEAAQAREEMDASPFQGGHRAGQHERAGGIMHTLSSLFGNTDATVTP